MNLFNDLEPAKRDFGVRVRLTANRFIFCLLFESTMMVQPLHGGRNHNNHTGCFTVCNTRAIASSRANFNKITNRTKKMSEIQRQLQFLQTVFPQTAASKLKKGKESFLFTAEKAARLTYEDVHIIGVDGLKELIRLDQRFGPFQETLFHVSSVDRNREMESQVENEHLDSEIENFLFLLSPFFLMKAAHKSIEYLVRRYKIHIFNVDAIMASILPYHETPLFSRFVQLLNISPTKWHFLEPMQSSGVVMSRSTLLQRCNTDFSVLIFICDAMKAYVERNIENKTFTNFYVVSLVEFIANNPLQELHLKRVLPYVFFGLKSNEPDLVAGSLMIITQIASSVTLTSSVVDSLIEAIITVMTKGDMDSVLMCLVFLFQSQPISKMRTSTMKALIELDGLIESINRVKSNYNLENFLNALLNTLIEYSFENRDATLLQNVINKIDFSKNIPKVIAVLLNLYISDQSFGEIIKKVLIVIERRYSSETDKGLQLGLQTLDEDFHGKALEFYSMIFKGSQHEIIPEISTTLYLSLQHHEKTVRILGLQHLSKIAKTASDEQTRSFISESLLERLNDEDPSILEYVLSIPEILKYVSPEKVASKISHIVKQIEENLTDNSSKKLSATIAEKLLTNEMIATENNLEKVLTFIFRFILITSEFKETNIKVIKSLQKLDHKLFAGLSSVEIKESDITSTNTGVITAISKNIAKHSELAKICESTAVNQGLGSKSVLILLSSAMKQKASTSSKLAIASSILRLVKGFSANLDEISAKDIFHPNKSDLVDPTLSLKNLTFQSAYALLENVDPEQLNFREISQYFTQSHSSSHTYSTLLAEFYETVCESKLFDQFTSHVKVLMEKHLKSSALEFLSCIWSSENTQYTTKMRSLMMGVLLMDDDVDYQYLLPSLLIALQNHSSKDMATVIISCIKRVPGTKAYKHEFQQSLKALPERVKLSITSTIESRISDISSDNTQIQQVLTELPSEFVEMLIQAVLCSHTAFQKYSLITVLSQMPSTRVMPALFDMLCSYLNKIENKTSLTRVDILIVAKLLKFLNIDLLSGKNSETYFTKGLLHAVSLNVPAVTDSSLSFVPSLEVVHIINAHLLKGLNENNQKALFNTVIKVLRSSKDTKITQAYQHVLKQLPLNVKILLSYLPESIAVDSMDTSESDKYEELTFNLEVIQLMKSVVGRETFSSRLFVLLKQLRDEWSVNKTKVEYPITMILSVLYSIASKLDEKDSSELAKKVEKTFDVDTILKCLTESDSAQVRNQAILLIGELASIFPIQIIDQILSVMKAVEGTLQDKDSFAFDAIQKTVLQIVPKLVEQQMDIKFIINVFVKSMKYIPKDKRLAFFSSLVKGTSRKNIYGFVILMLTQCVKSGDKDDTQVITAFCHELVEYFKIGKQLISIVKLASLAHSISKSDNSFKNAFYSPLDYEENEKQALFVFVLEFISEHLSSMEFLKMLIIEEEKDKETSQNFLLATAKTLNSIRDNVANSQTYIDLVDEVYGKVQQLLSSESFVAMIKSLLDLESPTIKERALFILNTRLTDEASRMVTKLVEDEGIFITLIRRLRKVLEEVEATKLLTQTAIISVELMSRRYAKTNQGIFIKVIPAIIRHLKESTFTAIISSAALCLSTLCYELGSETLEFLPEICPTFISHIISNEDDILEEKEEEDETNSSQLLVFGILSGLDLIVRVHLKFLSPYLKQIMNILLSSRIIHSKNKKISQKASEILHFLAVNAEPRHILEPVFSSLDASVAFGHESVVKLMTILFEIINVMDVKSVESFHSKIIDFFLETMDLRRKGTFERKIIETIEKSTCSTFEAFVLKLNEDLLKPSLRKIIDWSRESISKEEDKSYLDYGDKSLAPPDVSRLISFYKLVISMLNKLGFLFVPYFGYLWENIIRDIKAICKDVLDEDEEEQEEEDQQENSKKRKLKELITKKKPKLCEISSSEDRVQLAKLLLNSLIMCFLNDKESFVRSNDRFEQLIEPLAKMIEVEEVCEKNYDLISKAFGTLASAVTQQQWKPLQYQVLQKTKLESVIVKRTSIACLAAFYEFAGKEFITMLPEMMPYVAELLESEDEDVLQDTRGLVLTIEQKTGEEISHFLSE